MSGFYRMCQKLARSNKITKIICFLMIALSLIAVIQPAQAKFDVSIDTSAIEDTFTGSGMLEALDNVLGRKNPYNPNAKAFNTNAQDTRAGTPGSFMYMAVHDGVVQRVFRALAGVAAALVMLSLYIRIIQEAQRGDVTMDFWLRIFLAMALAWAVIFYLQDIMDGLEKFGYGLIDIIREQTNLSEERLQRVCTTQTEIIKSALLSKNAGVAEKFMVNACLQIMRLTTYIPKIAVYIAAFSAFFEIAMRRAFAPIAVADITAEGARSTGMRFFKKYVAVYLRIGMFYVICMISVQFSVTALQWGTNELAGKMNALQKVDTKLDKLFRDAGWEGAVRDIQEGIRNELHWDHDSAVPSDWYALYDPTYEHSWEVFESAMNRKVPNNSVWKEWKAAMKDQEHTYNNGKKDKKLTTVVDKKMIGEIVAAIDRIDLDAENSDDAREDTNAAQIARIRTLVKDRYKTTYDFTAMSVLSVMFKILIITLATNGAAAILMLRSKQFAQELVGL